MASMNLYNNSLHFGKRSETWHSIISTTVPNRKYLSMCTLMINCQNNEMTSMKIIKNNTFTSALQYLYNSGGFPKNKLNFFM